MKWTGGVYTGGALSLWLKSAKFSLRPLADRSCRGVFYIVSSRFCGFVFGSGKYNLCVRAAGEKSEKEDARAGARAKPRFSD